MEQVVAVQDQHVEQIVCWNNSYAGINATNEYRNVSNVNITKESLDVWALSVVRNYK
jgi:hypothetical protein